MFMPQHRGKIHFIKAQNVITNIKNYREDADQVLFSLLYLLCYQTSKYAVTPKFVLSISCPDSKK